MLPLAIDRAVTVTGRAAAELHFTSERFGRDDGWPRRVEAVAEELARLGRADVGFDGAIGGDLPAGAGLGSSGALGVAVARALCAVAGLELEPLDLARACRQAEERATGVPCGILDQAASALGVPGQALFIDCTTLEHRPVSLPDGIAVIVIDSGIRRRVSDTAYAERRRELEAGDERRARHVETENERVLAVVDALEHDDRPALGELFAAGHASLRDDYEVSTPELDALVERALEAGAFAARLTGAGFGGCVVALADAGRADRVAQTLTSRYAVWRER